MDSDEVQYDVEDETQFWTGELNAPETHSRTKDLTFACDRA